MHGERVDPRFDQLTAFRGLPLGLGIKSFRPQNLLFVDLWVSNYKFPRSTQGVSSLRASLCGR